jgi:mercuric ion binding protein
MRRKTMRSSAVGLAFSAVLMLVALATSAAPREVVLDVVHMSCPACPHIIEQSLRKVECVHAVEVSYEEKTARVVFDDAVTTLDALSDAIAALGFPSEPRKNGS